MAVLRLLEKTREGSYRVGVAAEGALRLVPTSATSRVESCPPAVVAVALEVGTWIAAAAVALQSVADLVGYAFFDRADQLNADAEPNLWSWASATATACAAFALLLLALTRPGRRTVLVFLAAATGFFSLDDALQVHERLRGVVGWEDPQRALWPAVYLPLLAAVFLLLWRVAGEAAPRIGLTIRLGLGFLVAAVACELISAVMVQVELGPGTLAYELEVIVEEGLELAGWILIASALAADLLDRVAAAGDGHRSTRAL